MKDLKGKRLLVLGGSIWKDAILKFAKENGIVVISAGLYPAGTDDIADEVYRIDTIDPSVMKKFIRDKSIDGVYLGGSELIIGGACTYVNELSLPCYCTKTQWEFLQNKANFKQLCKKYGLPVVPQFVIDRNNITGSVPLDAYPVITKPADGCGSNGFSVCYNEEELLEGYNKAVSDSSTESVICEKFVKNTGVVVFYTFSNGKVLFSGLEDKYPVRFEKQGSYVGGLFSFESRYTQEYRERFDSGIEQLFQSIGVKEGTAWIEVFHDGDNYYFNEVGFRYGGSISIYPINYLTGINQVAADIYFALIGESMPYGHTSLISDTIEKGLKYAIYPIYAGEGVINKVMGLDDLGKNVVFRTMTKSIGSHIYDCGSFNQNVAIIQFVYEDKRELKLSIERIHRNLQILDANGNNMIMQMLNVETIEL